MGSILDQAGGLFETVGGIVRDSLQAGIDGTLGFVKEGANALGMNALANLIGDKDQGLTIVKDISKVTDPIVSSINDTLIKTAQSSLDATSIMAGKSMVHVPDEHAVIPAAAASEMSPLARTV